VWVYKGGDAYQHRFFLLQASTASLETKAILRKALDNFALVFQRGRIKKEQTSAFRASASLSLLNLMSRSSRSPA